MHRSFQFSGWRLKCGVVGPGSSEEHLAWGQIAIEISWKRPHNSGSLKRSVQHPFFEKTELQALSVRVNTLPYMSITPKAIQDLLDELEASRQARRQAWDVLQDLRAVLTNLGNVTIEIPSRKTFDAEGAILKQALSDCLRDQRAALAQLADAARQVDKAAFGSSADFGPAHQALLKALDRAEVLLQD